VLYYLLYFYVYNIIILYAFLFYKVWRDKDLQKSLKNLSFYIALFIAFTLLASLVFNKSTPEEKFFSDLINDLKAGQIASLTIQDSSAYALYKDNKMYKINIPSESALYEIIGDEILKQVSEGSLIVETPPKQSPPWWLSLIAPLFFVIIIIMFWIFVMQQAQGGAGGAGRAMSFGKSRARLMTPDMRKTTFADVAGADEEKQELAEIVEFLKNPRKFIELGARIPKGVLLVGPPGTGKTLLAKAVAGEAGVPFFSISGSDFVEMYVGVGASRVRDLFEQARKNLPCIIFIDEIDAVGRHRGAGLGGGHDEREQTLNQLLVEMDGFGTNEGIIIIAATNRPDILDPALLRPGRFDRQVVVGVPDLKGREEIIKIHARNKPLAKDVDPKTIAKSTYGFTGADLENLLNESAILAARNNKKEITMQEIDEAMLKVIMCPEKKNRVIKPQDKEKTAYHEAGHAIVAKLLPTQDPVHQVSIVPRGRAGGFTLSLPDHDKTYVSKQEMLEEIILLMGGRVAEKLIFNEINTGASSDIDRATKIARNMVTKYGMSEKLGSITFGSDNNEVFIGKDLAQTRNYSEEIAAEIDREIKSIVDYCFKECERLISENIDKLHAVAKALLDKEKLSGEEFEEIFNNGYTPGVENA